MAWKNIDDRFDSRLDEAMKTKTLVVTLTLGVAAAAVCWAAAPKIEQALRDLHEHWSAASGAKDLDKTVSYYSNDAIVMPPNDTAKTTKDAIRALWKDLIE